MANNYFYYKEENGDIKTILDLRNLPLTSFDLADGVTAHDKNGNLIIGTNKNLSDNAIPYEKDGKLYFDYIPAEFFKEIRTVATSIKTLAFNSNYEIETVDLPYCSQIGESAFAGCINLKKVILSKSIKNIGENAFYQCSPDLVIYFRSSSLSGITCGGNWSGNATIVYNYKGD